MGGAVLCYTHCRLRRVSGTSSYRQSYFLGGLGPASDPPVLAGCLYAFTNKPAGLSPVSQRT